MGIEALCRQQRNIADRIFMDFKYTAPGSDEQIQALNTLHGLVGLWAHYALNAKSDGTLCLDQEPSRLKTDLVA